MSANTRSLVVDSILTILVLTLVPITIFSLYYPPVIVSQGQAHRIFYIHVPVAWVALYAPGLAAACGILYLATKKEIYDRWCHASSMVSLLFSAGVVISGPLWASTEWGTYWNWKDSRLMSFFILLLALAGYFLVRNLTDDLRTKKIYGSVMSVFAALAALFTWFAIRIVTPDTHPTSVMGKMHPDIRNAFFLSVAAYHFLFLLLMRITLRYEFVKREFEKKQANDYE